MVAPGYFFLKHLITGVVSTISPIEEKRMMRNFTSLLSILEEAGFQILL
jgi:hypothetical protein